jgi:hypothetical protein
MCLRVSAERNKVQEAARPYFSLLTPPSRLGSLAHSLQRPSSGALQAGAGYVVVVGASYSLSSCATASMRFAMIFFRSIVSSLWKL